MPCLVGKMTKEEELFVENHHAFVKHFLSQHKLDEREYYDVVIFAFLSAVNDYFSKTELRKKYTFEQIATRSMKYAYWANLRYETRKARYPKPISMDQQHREFKMDTLKNPIEQIIENENIRELVSTFTESEKEIVILRLLGYRTREIAERCGISIKGVHSRLYRLRKKIRCNMGNKAAGTV